MNTDNPKIIVKISIISIIVNIILTVFKLFVGIFSNSGAMVSDAVHSASDVFSTIIVIIGAKMAQKDSDKEHPYGHERMECVAAIILSAILFFTGIMIGYSGFMKIISGDYGSLVIPGVLSLIAAVISIVCKEVMYQITMKIAKRINSSALKADAWHHRSDALSSIGSFIGIFAARKGFPIFDSIASVVICLFILKAAVDIFRDAISKMTDQSCNEETIKKMSEEISAQNGVLRIDQIKTRLFGDKIYVDIEIATDGNLTLFESHEIAQNVHDAIEAKFTNVKHCMVHVNPFE
ncbi:MAG: cation transporter [Clostridia bacterium]|nr:cation transporter [Clostridia bacterium]